MLLYHGTRVGNPVCSQGGVWAPRSAFSKDGGRRPRISRACNVVGPRDRGYAPPDRQAVIGSTGPAGPVAGGGSALGRRAAAGADAAASSRYAAAVVGSPAA